MSFRSRTALSLAALTSVALGGAFAGVSHTFISLQLHQLDESMRIVARQEAVEAPSNGFRFSRRMGPAESDIGPLTMNGVIYDEMGRVLSSTSPFDREPPSLGNLVRSVGAPFDFRFGEELYRGLLVGIPGQPGKQLFLAASRADLDGDASFLHKAMVVAFLVATAWAVAIGTWISGRLTSAHHLIALVARAVTRGDLGARVMIDRSDAEVVQLGRDINAMIERLSDLLSSQERFVSHAAHELRSPLAALQGELQKALRKERDADAYRLAIETALVSVRRLIQLAEDLLSLARSRSDSVDGRRRIEVAAAVAEARRSVEPIAQRHGVEIETFLESRGRLVDRNGDISRLLRNLLENAIRHSPRHGSVRLTACDAAEMIEIRICDDGPGVPKGDREAIFRPFFRSSGSSSSEGFGLGLSIAREIARSHLGDVMLDDGAGSVGPGACFVVRLPGEPANAGSESVA